MTTKTLQERREAQVGQAVATTPELVDYLRRLAGDAHSEAKHAKGRLLNSAAARLERS